MKKKEATKSVTPIAGDFAEVVQLIESARKQAYQAVNTTLIEQRWSYYLDSLAAKLSYS